ncbi:MAG: hypothetical protein PHV59_01195 [Victivallales bacterium]|nr:hypothetical protein [Victivallales bacterium]
MKNFTCVFVLCLALAISAGCSRQPKITVDTTPFEKSISVYCRSHNYGMKVKEFVSLQVNGDQAEGVAKMQEAEGTYGLAPKWRFKFARQNGKWETVSHNAK